LYDQTQFLIDTVQQNIDDGGHMNQMEGGKEGDARGGVGEMKFMSS